MEGKIIELPDVILLKIMGYLSNHDILRNVSQVSKRFYVLSKDQHLFRKIEMDCRNLPSSGKKPSKLAPCPTTAGPSQYCWSSFPDSKGFYSLTDLALVPEQKYCRDFLDVFKRSITLKTVSFEFGWNFDGPGKIICNELTAISGHQFLEEFHFESGDGRSEEFLNYLRKILYYLCQCPKLRKLKFEFTVTGDLGMLLDIIGSEILINVEELHLNTLDIDIKPRKLKNVLKKMTENMPKLRCLSLTLWLDCVHRYAEIQQEMASEINFNIKIINPKDPNVYGEAIYED